MTPLWCAGPVDGLLTPEIQLWIVRIFNIAEPSVCDTMQQVELGTAACAILKDPCPDGPGSLHQIVKIDWWYHKRAQNTLEWQQTRKESIWSVRKTFSDDNLRQSNSFPKRFLLKIYYVHDNSVFGVSWDRNFQLSDSERCEKIRNHKNLFKPNVYLYLIGFVYEYGLLTPPELRDRSIWKKRSFFFSISVRLGMGPLKTPKISACGGLKHLNHQNEV